MLNGLFDIDNRLDYLTENGDMLPHGRPPGSEEREELLRLQEPCGGGCQLQNHKGCNGHPLTSWEKQGNRTRARTRSRIEHIFGTMTQRAGNLILRSIGISRAEVKLVLLTQHRIQHGEILLFDEAGRIKGGFPEKKQIKCRLFQSRILEKEKSKR